MIVPFDPSRRKLCPACKRHWVASLSKLSTLSLANKLQRLVLLDPAVGRAIERIVDGALREMELD